MKDMTLEEGDVLYAVDKNALKTGRVLVTGTMEVVAVTPKNAYLPGAVAVKRALQQRGDWLVVSGGPSWIELVYENEAVKDAKRRKDLASEITATDLSALSAARLECLMAIIKL